MASLDLSQVVWVLAFDPDSDSQEFIFQHVPRVDRTACMAGMVWRLDRRHGHAPDPWCNRSLSDCTEFQVTKM